MKCTKRELKIIRDCLKNATEHKTKEYMILWDFEYGTKIYVNDDEFWKIINKVEDSIYNQNERPKIKVSKSYKKRSPTKRWKI